MVNCEIFFCVCERFFLLELSELVFAVVIILDVFFYNVIILGLFLFMPPRSSSLKGALLRTPLQCLHVQLRVHGPSVLKLCKRKCKLCASPVQCSAAHLSALRPTVH